ncbi:MAG: hypothetical protein WA089_00195, partial [Anaerolineae bacterium]
MNPFLPKGYEPPAQSGGRYLKITKNGEARVRIVSPSPILGWEYWTDDNKPRRLRERPATKPADMRAGSNENPEKLRHFWAMAVFDYADSVVKVWEVTQATIQRTIADLAADEDWGHPSGYDLKIKRDDQTGRTTYAVAPVPHKPLSADAKRIVAETSVNLDALFSGDDPFAAKQPNPAPAAPPEPAISQTTFPDHVLTAELPPLTAWQRSALHSAGTAYYGKAWDEKRHSLVLAVTKGRTQSSADLTTAEANALIDGINRRANEDANAAKTSLSATANLGMMAMAED